MEGLLSLNAAIRSVCGTAPHRSTVVRWTTKGIKARNGERVKLATKRIGGRFYSHPDWVKAFIEKTSEEIEVSVPTYRSASQRQRDTDKAKAALDDLLN